MENKHVVRERMFVPRAAVAVFFQYCKEATRCLQDVEEEALGGQGDPPQRKRPKLH